MASRHIAPAPAPVGNPQPSATLVGRARLNLPRGKQGNSREPLVAQMLKNNC